MTFNLEYIELFKVFLFPIKNVFNKISQVCQTSKNFLLVVSIDMKGIFRWAINLCSSRSQVHMFNASQTSNKMEIWKHIDAGVTWKQQLNKKHIIF